MTTPAAETTAGAPESTASSRPIGRWLVLFATPLLLGATLWFHPGGGEDTYASLVPVLDAWVTVHVLLLPLFGLLGVSLYLLLDGYDGRVATVGRAGVATYLVCYVPFEAIAGLTTGLVIREAETLRPEQREGAAQAVQAITADPVVLALALGGTAGAVVAVGAIAVLLRSSGAPLAPVVLLAGVPLTVVAHGGTRADAVGMALFFVSVAWIELGWRRSNRAI